MRETLAEREFDEMCSMWSEFAAETENDLLQKNILKLDNAYADEKLIIWQNVIDQLTGVMSAGDLINLTASRHAIAQQLLAKAEELKLGLLALKFLNKITAAA